MKKLKLLKVIVQPVFVLEDGDDIQELVSDPVVVGAKDWPTYATKGYAEGFTQLEAQLTSEKE